jgi:uncharacterized protein
MILNLIFLVLLITFTLMVVAAWQIAEKIIRSPREVRPEDWAKLKLKPEFVNFSATDGVRISGAFIKGYSPATIILLHGYGHSKTQLLPQAVFLNHAGFNILSFDFRASGESGGDYITFGHEETRDLEGAVNYLHTRKDVDPDKLGIFGFSMGGSVAVLKGGDLKGLKAIVVNSSYSEFRSLIELNFQENAGHMPFFPLGNLILYIIKVRTGAYFSEIQPLKHMRSLGNIPLLFIHGTKDRTVPVWDAVRMHSGSYGPAELMLVQGAGHNDTYTSQKDVYEKKITSFFKTHLLE